MWLGILLLFLHSNTAMPQSIVKTLPGFPGGDLPFKLETGYVGVGDLESVQLFYYFIESERDPKKAPLLLWLTGGPGCSGFSGLVYEVGPLSFNFTDYNGASPKLMLNPFSWTKVASIIFVDAPVGTGFSYATDGKSYNVSDTTSVTQLYQFLRKWLISHPLFLTNELYISGDSYSGLIIPMLVQEITNGNQVGVNPLMNLQGYIMGNPLTDVYHDLNSRVKFAHRVSILSDELYEDTEEACDGNYIDIDPTNSDCVNNISVVNQCLLKIYHAQILENDCNSLEMKRNLLKWDRSSLGWIRSMDDLRSSPKNNGPWCREYNYLPSYIWANDKNVQDALYIREGTKVEWLRCNKSLSYTATVESVVEYHRNLSYKGYQALVYSGDHDLVIPYVGTHGWISYLNFTISTLWQPWFVDGQVAGFTETHKNNKYLLTFATVKGGGHTAPEYKPKECLAMIDRWLSHFPL